MYQYSKKQTLLFIVCTAVTDIWVCQKTCQLPFVPLESTLSLYNNSDNVLFVSSAWVTHTTHWESWKNTSSSCVDLEMQMPTCLRVAVSKRRAHTCIATSKPFDIITGEVNYTRTHAPLSPSHLRHSSNKTVTPESKPKAKKNEVMQSEKNTRRSQTCGVWHVRVPQTGMCAVLPSGHNAVSNTKHHS